eukprot:GHVS01077174.1.p1 GENE.GHVS01077174.1~~GHVS01077174.1.p1  ORF type:complete len:327 (+),score=28.59 GHVS01077174.1:235-1215(+)
MWGFGRQMASFFSDNMTDDPSGSSSGGGRFRKHYACYPVSFVGKDVMEKGNKILLPQSALHQLARMNITWPMLFEMTNPNTGRMTHSGVLEFVAEEGTCYMPYWMMQNLLLKEGDIVQVVNTSLPKGQYVKLQPVTKDFLEVSNPRAVLENAFRNYATLTVGDNVVIQYLDKSYEIEVVELKPSPAVSIIETDIQVDFQAPKDYTEPLPPPAESEDSDPITEDPVTTNASNSSMLFQGTGRTLTGKLSKGSGLLETHASRSAVRKMSNFSDISRGSSPPHSQEVEEEPWKSRLPGGVRTSQAEYTRMVAEGRLPGVMGRATLSRAS